jgi:predicted pyridoxine 5'-phosphate oxidase superfamily flavin-nucleotide-binding protein
VKTFGEIAFTPAVRDLQSRHGSRDTYARMEHAAVPGEGPVDGLGQDEADFLARADSFYLATVGETGWPYVQHRGGPRGFLRVLSPARLAFADFRGNRQFVSAGNAARDNRVSLIVVDYPNRRRLKILGRLRFEDLPAAGAALAQDIVDAVALPPGYRARPERVAVIEVEAFDWNCPQHITPRYTLEEVERATQPLRERIAALEAALARQAAAPVKLSIPPAEGGSP